MAEGSFSISAMQATAAGANARLGQSYLGRSLQIGAAESFGMYYSGSAFGASGAISEGFLGMRGSFGALAETATERGGTTYMNSMLKNVNEIFEKRAMKMSGPASTRFLLKRSTLIPRAKILGSTIRHAGLKAGGKFLASTAMKGLGLAGTAYFAYQGYQEGGVLGAAGGVAESVLYSAAFRAVGGALFNPATAGIAGAAAIGYGVYQAGEAATRHARSLSRLEMGGEHMMNAIGSSGAATSRQRSVMALQNTHLNGRMAMGNEALLMHTSFR